MCVRVSECVIVRACLNWLGGGGLVRACVCMPRSHRCIYA